MSLVNCLTDRGRKILEMAEEARQHAENLPVNADATAANAYAAIHALANGLDALVMSTEPLWEKRDESECPDDGEG